MTDVHEVRITRAARVSIGLAVPETGHHPTRGGDNDRNAAIHPAEVRGIDIDAEVPVRGLCAASTGAGVVQRPARRIEVDVAVDHPIAPLRAGDRPEQQCR